MIALPTNTPVPLPDLIGTYFGLDGGLYGGGSNTPPDSQAKLGDEASARVEPLNAQGRPSAKGQIGMLAIGQSTTRMIFESFQKMTRHVPNRSNALSLVNGAQEGMVLQSWSKETAPWRVALRKVQQSRLTARQVQVVWFESAEVFAWEYGDLNARLTQTASDIGRVLRKVKSYFPNARLVFLSSRPYGGYGPHSSDPEPFAYEGGFGVRHAIQQQIQGDPSLNADPARGPEVAPVALWGPYLWANGVSPSSTGLSWSSSDFTDGIHPDNFGRIKAANVLKQFFTTDPRAKSWFLR